ncbi:MAG: PDZ domain-containing protein [Acidobacteriota bacterium]|nr:PDZ domain-containing protein [Acidobacteriota bacterium]
MNSRAKFVVVMSSTFLVVLLLLGGVVTKGAAADNSTNDNNVYKHLSVYSEVLSRIKSEYVEEPDMSSVTLGAMNGMLESIDPYASYLNANQFKEYLKNFDTFKGDLGMVLAKKYGYITVVAVVPGSPADKAGLTTGDFIESIKGIATRDMPLAYARLLLKGEPGTDVEMSVLRRKPEPQKITLTRAVIVVPPVESKMLPDNLGYIKVSELTSGKTKEVAAAVESLQKQGAKKLLLDLRFCAAGDPDEGVDLANLFLDKGTIGYYQGQKVARKDLNADASKDITSLPLIVLVNRGTASAAEVATAALQDDKRATVVGEHTYGDASIRRPIQMEDGSAIILSVAKYYGPAGKSIQDNGITPNEQVVDQDPGIGDDDDDQNPVPAPKKSTEDLILKKAIEVAQK